MLNENLTASLGLKSKIFQELSVAIRICAWKVPNIRMSVRTGTHGQLMDKGSANCNLYTLDPVHHREAKLPIKSIPLPDGFEVCIWQERIVGLLEWMPVGAEAVVANGFEAADKPRVVGHDHSA